jgi:hypothetical protein
MFKQVCVLVYGFLRRLLLTFLAERREDREDLVDQGLHRGTGRAREPIQGPSQVIARRADLKIQMF